MQSTGGLFCSTPGQRGLPVTPPSNNVLFPVGQRERPCRSGMPHGHHRNADGACSAADQVTRPGESTAADFSGRTLGTMPDMGSSDYLIGSQPPEDEGSGAGGLGPSAEIGDLYNGITDFTGRTPDAATDIGTAALTWGSAPAESSGAGGLSAGGVEGTDFTGRTADAP